MPSDRVTAAFQRDAAQRHSDYDVGIKISGVQGLGIFGDPRSAKYLREGGFVGEHDCKLIIRKSAWPAFTSRRQLEGATIELSLNGAWIPFTVAAVADLYRSGEWKLELHAKVA